MKLWKQNRTPGLFWTLAFAMLASCVFFWGLQYKLSLYDPPQAASHHVPMAKLQSKNEKSNVSEESPYIQADASIQVLYAVGQLAIVFLLVGCVLLTPVPSRREWAKGPELHLRDALTESFFVRPPPALS